MPYFCETKKWNYFTYRRLCQENIGERIEGPLYDCSLTERYNEYSRWLDNMCCSDEFEYLSMRACISNKCVQDDTILNLVYENHKNKFIFEHGFDPPLSRPRGKFVMNSEIQEDLSNPFETKNEGHRKWKSSF